MICTGKLAGTLPVQSNTFSAESSSFLQVFSRLVSLPFFSHGWNLRITDQLVS